MKKTNILTFLFFLPLFSFSQFRFENKTFTTFISYSRLDFFQMNNFGLQKKRFSAEVGFGFGVIKSIFQQRFFPRFNIKTSYSIFKSTNKFNIYPHTTIAFSQLLVNKQSKTIHYFIETNLGIQFSYGNKHSFGISPEIGIINERFSNNLNNKFKYSTFNYCLSVFYKLKLFKKTSQHE